ncbi:MAG: helix-turn-helix transcriptional regulator [Phycisphaerales bacterium JB037]
MTRRSDDAAYLRQRSNLSVADMARAVGLSRSRFYALMESGTFPPPIYLIATRRPFYDERLKEQCLEIRRSGLGLNGEPVLFYPKRIGNPTRAPGRSSSARKRPTARAVDPRIRHLAEMLKGLGIAEPQPAAIDAALRDCFPEGVEGRDDSELVAAVFRRLRSSE